MNEINLKDGFIKMFSDDNIRKLPENATWCDKCSGIGWHDKETGYISLCVKCSGKGFTQPRICECGKEIKYFYGNTCTACTSKEFIKKEHEKNIERYSKAKKVKFKDYEGKFWRESWDCIKDCDDFEEWLYQLIFEGEDYPTWVFATEKQLHLNIDINDVVYEACEEGYEDMYSNLDTESLAPIQQQIEKWIEEQGDSAYVYSEDYSIVIELTDLIQEMKKEIGEFYD